MRRFSQRNSLVTLSDINITPLLDLAFVLLIIFVITTPLLEQSVKLNLPTGGKEDPNPRPKDQRRTVEIARDGSYVMAGRKMSLNDVEATLVQAVRSNPKVGVIVRADTTEQYGKVLTIVDLCQRLNIEDFGFSTRNEKR